MLEIEPLELKSLFDQAAKVCLIDVREPEEFDLVRLPEAILVPLMELESRRDEILSLCRQEWDSIIVYCRSGRRSALAVEWLESLEIKSAKNLRGGINAYAVEADQTLEPY